MVITVYIDISAQLENWTADSVVAMTDGVALVLVVPSAVKQAVRAWLRERFPSRRGSYHAYVLLVILIYLILQSEVEHVESIVIDADYMGEGSQGKIENELAPLLRRNRPHLSGKQIHFQKIKGTRADKLAREVYLEKNRQRWRHLVFAETRSVLEK